MNRLFASMLVLGLGFLAIAICVRQTLVHADELGSRVTSLLTIESIMGAGLFAIICVLFFRRRSRASKREGFAVVQPLRRLFAGVWS
jgi:hypothetical protein